MELNAQRCLSEQLAAALEREDFLLVASERLPPLSSKEGLRALFWKVLKENGLALADFPVVKGASSKRARVSPGKSESLFNVFNTAPGQVAGRACVHVCDLRSTGQPIWSTGQPAAVGNSHTLPVNISKNRLRTAAMVWVLAGKA